MRKVLLIDDDRLQHRLTQGFFLHFRGERFELDWADNYEAGLARLLANEHAACLLDYQLGTRDGLQLIREAVAGGSRVPIVFLTAETDESIDVQAMDAGALDYLVKGEINVRSLERSLRYAMKLAESLEAMRRLATRDELTGLLNRREFERLLADEVERSRRFDHAMSVVFLDVDFFKKVNDTYGHATGDDVLREVARRIQGELRSVDRVARFGGEEFAVLLPETVEPLAAGVAQRIVINLAAQPIVARDGVTLPVTISAGVAAWLRENGDAGVIERADQALYAAKAAGRNRAVRFSELAQKLRSLAAQNFGRVPDANTGA